MMCYLVGSKTTKPKAVKRIMPKKVLKGLLTV
jgi:hypothetical protein